ncbi:programmed cell death 1 ligand 2-like [Rhinoderma darwinii]|uniref:programmed cell death 1 ligand 2-like n=1 Tax=Rhinoderma darwinii TaxID=43563 RepID=UPI003F67AC6F
MLCIKLSFFIFLDFHTIIAFFVVKAPNLTYTARYGDTVQMICNFPVPKEDDLNKLTVSWQHFPPQHDEARQVTMFTNGRESVLSQEKTYNGRASLLIQELKNGLAILQIGEVNPTDAGTYLCVLQLGGSDYKEITLNVQASYRNIETSSHISEDNEISLMCESLGFPKAEVYWKKNEVNLSLPVNTSHTQTPNGLYKITSTIKGIDMNQRYNCVFWNKELNEETEASLKHSGLLTHASNYNRYPQRNDSGHHTQPLQTAIITTIIGFIVVFLVVIILFLKRRQCFKCFKKKGDRSSAL